MKKGQVTLAAIGLILGSLCSPAWAEPDSLGALITDREFLRQFDNGDALGDFLSDNALSSSFAALPLNHPLEPKQSLGPRSGIVNTAMGFIGVPYRYGGNGPQDGGFDCSGLVRSAVQRALGQSLPRRAADQAHATRTIQKDELQPGDLVFFNTMKRAFSHVGIYVGDNKFIHAPSSGKLVRVENMNNNYWQSRFNGARRVDSNNAVAER